MLQKELTILEVIKYGNPILTARAAEVKDIDDQIRKLAQNMVLTMHSVPGIGLAAPQVGQSIRLFTADLSVGERKEDLIVLVNPEIIVQEGEEIQEEGCLSVPDINEKVKRPYYIRIKGLSLDGAEKDLEAEGLLARVFCHEIDHLNGKLFIERLSPLKRSLIKKKLKKTG